MYKSIIELIIQTLLLEQTFYKPVLIAYRNMFFKKHRDYTQIKSSNYTRLFLNNLNVLEYFLIGGL